MSKYATPGDFRAALTDKLRNLAERGPWNLQQLRRQFAYDRLLERLYMLDGEWIVKGAVALLARDIGVRSSLDIDLYRAKAADAAEQDLRTATSRDIGDRFRFEIGPREPVSDDAKAVRFKVDAYIGNQRWERFPIDLVGSDLHMRGEPDDVPAIVQIDMPELQQKGYRAYPLVDHIADKVAATFDLYGSSRQPSTRYRDLVDLVAIARGATVHAEPALPPCGPRRSAAASRCRRHSMCQTMLGGSRDTQPRRRGQSSRMQRRWTRLCRSFGRS